MISGVRGLRVAQEGLCSSHGTQDPPNRPYLRLFLQVAPGGFCEEYLVDEVDSETLIVFQLNLASFLDFPCIWRYNLNKNMCTNAKAPQFGEYQVSILHKRKSWRLRDIWGAKSLRSLPKELMRLLDGALLEFLSLNKYGSQ